MGEDMMVNLATMTVRPEHVPPDRVHDFDMYGIPGGELDAQAAYHAVQQKCPDLFWTPRNGGHWVATRSGMVEAILRDDKRFSNQRVFLPRDDNAPKTIPLESDAPLHTELRKPLSRALFPKIIDAMEPNIRLLTVSLVQELCSKGRCEFVEDFAKVMPMCLFLDLVALPREERHILLPLVERFVKGGDAKIRAEAQQAVFAYIGTTVRARRETPGPDLASIVVNGQFEGNRISEADATSYLSLILFGGLDTVASMLTFIVFFLAKNPDKRHNLLSKIDDEGFLKQAIEEMLRRFGIVTSARVIVENTIMEGVLLHANDMILPVNLLCGLDDRLIDDPLEVDFNREKRAPHLAFGAGPHGCPGATLARREIKIFLEEWLRVIPNFAVAEGVQPRNVMGVTCSIEALPLVWQVT